MRFSRTRARTILSAFLGVATGSCLLAGTAEAATSHTQDPAAARGFACGTFGSYTNGPGRVTPFTVTGGCRDININLTSAQAQTFGRSCLNPGAGERCSSWQLLPFGWTTLSTNVRGGTRFSVDLSGNNGRSVSYELAY